ncbi:phage tail protein [Erwinia pyrifoliae]|uniref:phage tail protein n=1 Tax=Erwinia pyrifoliae TaxID=79967 RepID=UPI0021D799D3|nr:phage tail protein [Erwinia pyrifoliae]MCU8587614.1 phage tail protein [Erwinia pyrifoliae]
MANLPETPQWEDGIYQIEVSDPVLGGPDGISNRQAKQLASRTSYLKQKVEKGGTDLDAHLKAADPHTQYAPKANPVLTGTPTAPTPVSSDNSKKLATTEFVARALAALAGTAPETLDTLKELADALGNDPNFATTVLANLSEKLAKDQNGADIPDKVVFRQSIGLPELLAAKASINGAADKKFLVLSVPGDNNAAVPVSLLNAGLDKKANLAGDSNIAFYISNSGNATAAVNNDRLNFVLGGYAYRGGDAAQGFAVSGGVSANSAVAYNQFQSGTNGNGAWVKLPGGGQWCRQNLSIPANSTITWTFPAAFGSTPALFFSTFNGAPNVWFNGASASGANLFNANSSAINVNILAIW